MSMKFSVKIPTFLDERLSSAPTTGGKRPGPAKVLTAQLSEFGINETMLNLDKLSLAMKYKAAMVLSEIGIDLLSKALPLTPVDSGELRRSGEVTLQFFPGDKVVASGSGEGQVVVRDAEVPLSKLRSVNKMDMLVQFYRTNEFGEDIALWTHEDINYYTSKQSPRARTEGTGPKYLETPWMENKGDYVGMLYELANIRDSVKRATRVVRKGKGKTDVDVITLDTNKLLSRVIRRA